MGKKRPVEVGERFKRLVVVRLEVRLSNSGRPQSYADVVCDCGGKKTCRASHLRHGNIASCGCLARDTAAKLAFRHGHARGNGSRTYISWSAMVDRCCNESSKDWPRYGGRGITVCARWRTFENFLADMGERPAGRTIDRKNNNGNYEPSNCRWATAIEQARSKRNSYVVSVAGVTATVAEIRKRTGLTREEILRRATHG